MVDMNALLALQGQLFLLMALGAFFSRRGILDGGFQKGLTDLVIDLILPCSIITSFEVDLTEELFRQSIQVAVSSLVIQVGCWLLAHAAFRRCAAGRQPVLQYAVICSNAGFLGTPVAQGLFGAPGVVLASIYLIPQRVAMWTLGVAFFEKSNGKAVWKRVVTHPCIVAVFLGAVLLFTGLRLPGVVDNTVRAVGDCNTGLSMFLVGMLMSRLHWRDFLDPTVLYYSFIRLVVIPLAVFAGCRLAGLSGLPAAVSVVLAAMPAGATTAILASRYECDSAFAASCVTVSTVFSLVAIPVWCMFF